MPPASALGAGGRMVGGTRERFGLRRILVVTQIALSLVLVAGAMLFVGSLRKLLTLDAGFQQSGILLVDVDFDRLPMAKDQRALYKAQIVQRIRALPGVQDAAAVAEVPLGGNTWANDVVIGGAQKGNSLLDRVSDRYFKTMGTPLLAGRDFGEQDTATSPRVAIVNESFAKKFLGGSAMGKTFRLTVYRGDPDYEFEVVGVVKDTKYRDLREDFHPIAFFPESQDPKPDQFTTLAIRSQMPLETLAGEVKHSFEQLNPSINLTLKVFQTQLRDSLLRERLMASLSGFFGILAGVLAAIGIYGVIAYMVARRTNEIGVRMALGATPGNVLGMVLGEAAVLLAAGTAVGLAATALAGRAAQALLFGLKPYDPLTLVLAVAALAAVAFAASYWPAHRAARLQPMTALREQ